MRAGGVHEAVDLGKRRLPVVGGLIILHIRELQRQLLFGDRHIAALVAVGNGDRLAPVTLPGEDPVAELIVDLGHALPGLLQPLLDLLLGLLHGQAVQESGVDHDAGLTVGESFLLNVAALDHLDHRQTEGFGKLIVPGVVSRNRHDGAGAVAHQDVVGNKDGDLPTVDGIDGHDALQPDAGLVLVDLGALKVGLFGGLRLIRPDLIHVGQPGSPLLNVRMLRRNDHIGGAEQGVRPGGVNFQSVAGIGVEVHLCTGGAADPVDLGGFDPVNVVYIRQIVDEPLGIFGDL